MYYMWNFSSDGRDIGVQYSRHILDTIVYAVFHDRLTSLTLSVVTEEVCISLFRSDGSHIQFHDEGCIAGPLHLSLSIPRYLTT